MHMRSGELHILKRDLELDFIELPFKTDGIDERRILTLESSKGQILLAQATPNWCGRSKNGKRRFWLNISGLEN